MNFSLIADFADLLAAFGIVASLVFVSMQVRQNTTALKNTHLESSIDRDTLFYSRAYDPPTATIIRKGQQSYGSLDDVERLTFESWMREFLTSYASTFLLARQGLLRSELRDMHEQRVRWVFRHQGAREWWHSENRIPLPVDTVAWIDKTIGTS